MFDQNVCETSVHDQHEVARLKLGIQAAVSLFSIVACFSRRGVLRDCEKRSAAVLIVQEEKGTAARVLRDCCGIAAGLPRNCAGLLRDCCEASANAKQMQMNYRIGPARACRRRKVLDLMKGFHRILL